MKKKGETVMSMNTSRVSLSSIVADKAFNVRKNLGGIKNADPKSESDKDTTIEKLAAEIKRDGLINPLVVKIDEKGRNLLIAGFRRHAALTLLAKEDAAKYSSVEVRVYEGSLEDCYFLNLTENTARNDLTPFEIGERCYFIRNESKKWNRDGKESSLNSIADRVGGHSRGYIGNLIRAFEFLNTELLKRWEKESMGTAGDNVRYMLTDRINKLIAEKDKDAQLDMKVFDGLSWKEVKAGVKPAEDGEKAKEEKAEADGPNRPTPKVLESTLAHIKSDEFDEPDATVTILTQAIEYALGKRKTLFGYNPVKAAEAEKKAKEEEKAALKEQKEAEKLAAKEEKTKAKANGAKGAQAEASA